MSLTWTPEEKERLGCLFDEAVGLQIAERGVFMQRAAHQYPALFAELNSLVESYDRSGNFLETPVVPSLASSAIVPLTAGSTFDDFVILKPLGRGGFADVYLANQVSLHRKVALKISANFGQEAKTMAALEHDNIVRVFSEQIDAKRGLRWICMQYAAGASLDLVIKNLPTVGTTGKTLLKIVDTLSAENGSVAMEERRALAEANYPDAVFWIGMKIAEALAFAHGRGVVHLDVKPANILLTSQGRPLLADFNISVSSNAPTEGLSGGTAAYMAPEQKAGTPLDGRADIYSLGKVLGELLEKGGVPVSWEKPRTAYDAILARCCAQRPEDRYPSAAVLAAAIGACLELGRLQNELPARTVVARATVRWPLFAFGFFVFLPEVAATIVNHSYRALWIMSRFGETQQAFFHTLVRSWAAFIFPFTLIILIFRLWPIRRVLLSTPAQIMSWSPSTRAQLRRRAVTMLWRLSVIIICAWAPGGLVFPWVIHAYHGPLDLNVFIHFFLSSLLSCVLALSYSAAYLQYVVLREVYPRLLAGELEPRKLATQECTGRSLTFPAFHGVAGLIPLTGALLMLLLGDPGRASLFHSLVAFLVGLGIMGLVLSQRSMLRVQSIIQCLLNRPRSEDDVH